MLTKKEAWQSSFIVVVVVAVVAVVAVAVEVVGSIHSRRL